MKYFKAGQYKLRNPEKFRKNSRRIIDLISESKKIILTTHINPDGDALGSELAVYDYLKQLGKKSIIINHSPTPDNFKFLDRKKIIRFYHRNRDENNRLIKNADLIFILDTNQYSRTKCMADPIRKSAAKKICIDHHLGSNENHYEVILSDTNSPATSSILYEFFKLQNPGIINRKIATCLYAGIMTDTGSFRYPRTTEKTFLVCADLIKRGADPVWLYDEIYNKLNPEKIKLFGKFVTSITYHFGGKLAVGIVTLQDFKDYHSDVQDVEGFSTFIMSIGGVEAGFVIVELKDSLKCSFRSKGNINIKDFASIFGGGGHKNAAGASLAHQNPFEFKKKLISEYKKFPGK